MTVGAITVALGLALRMRGVSQWIMWEVAGLFENIGTVHDGMGMLTKPVSIVDRPQAAALAVSRGEIVFDHARFHYGRATKVIEDFTLTIRPGEKVGVVGRSGAGKSTLVNLLMRFYDLEGGRILIDGQDIAARHAGVAPPRDRHGDAGHLAAPPLGHGQHPLRPARGDAARRRSPRPSWPTPTASSAISPTPRAGAATTPMSASAASSSPAASASASRSPASSSRTRRSSSSTRRPARSIRRSRRRSRNRSTA